eukprot:1181922-Prorocentrum_minimum.AAC.2
MLIAKFAVLLQGVLWLTAGSRLPGWEWLKQRPTQVGPLVPSVSTQGEQLRETISRETTSSERLQREEDGPSTETIDEEECQIHVAPKHAEGGTAQLDWVFKFDQSTRYTHMGVLGLLHSSAATNMFELYPVTTTKFGEVYAHTSCVCGCNILVGSPSGTSQVLLPHHNRQSRHLKPPRLPSCCLTWCLTCHVRPPSNVRAHRNSDTIVTLGCPARQNCDTIVTL